MVCEICGADKENPIRMTCDECREKRKCEYCGKKRANWNIGNILGGEDKWGCNSCLDKLVKKKKKIKKYIKKKKELDKIYTDLIKEGIVNNL